MLGTFVGTALVLCVVAAIFLFVRARRNKRQHQRLLRQLAQTLGRGIGP